MKKKEKDHSVKEKFIEACNIPKDAALGFPIITLVGKKEVYIESYRGILEYNHEMIRVLTKLGQIKIKGKTLEVDYYTNDEMKITGTILSVEYC